MSALSTPRHQQLGLSNKILRRNDSVASMPSASTASSIAPSFSSLTQENDKLAQDNARLQKRNEELIQQSQLNQNLFQETFEALTAKESEITNLEGIQKALKERIHRSDDASNEAMHTLGLQLEDLATQLEQAQETLAKREALLTKLESQQQQHQTKDASKQQQHHRHHQQELDDLSAAHVAQLRERNKTIHFLRDREGKAYKHIDRLREKLADAEKLSQDWVATITLTNSKTKAMEVKPQAGIGKEA